MPPTLIFLIVLTVAGFWWKGGFWMAMSYVALFVGVTIGTLFLRIAWELYRQLRQMP